VGNFENLDGNKSTNKRRHNDVKWGNVKEWRDEKVHKAHLAPQGKWRGPLTF